MPGDSNLRLRVYQSSAVSAYLTLKNLNFIIFHGIELRTNISSRLWTFFVKICPQSKNLIYVFVMQTALIIYINH